MFEQTVASSLVTRRSDRILIHMPLEISGTDAAGQRFIVKGTTHTVSRYGASIAVPRSLAPEQDVTISCAGKVQGKVRVLGQIGIGPAGGLYCVAFREPMHDFWGVHFPPVDSGADCLAKVLLECGRCSERKIFELNHLELQVFETNASLTRHCETCARNTSWQQVDLEAPTPRSHRTEDKEAAVAAESAAEAKPAPPPEPAKTGAERRKFRRTRVKMIACVPPPDGIGPDDIVDVLDLSKGGVRFRSFRKYMVGQWLNIAVPYTRGAANIFTQGRIMWAGRTSSDDSREFGLRYMNMNTPQQF